MAPKYKAPRTEALDVTIEVTALRLTYEQCLSRYKREFPGCTVGVVEGPGGLAQKVVVISGAPTVRKREFDADEVEARIDLSGRGGILQLDREFRRLERLFPNQEIVIETDEEDRLAQALVLRRNVMQGAA